MASKKNLQLVDLGINRRIEITTADDKHDPYARFTEKDLEGLRKSVQDPLIARLQDENRSHLDAWSNFHQKVEMEEGAFTDEPQLMNGQSHRAHLHFDMRHKEGLVSKPGGHGHHTQAGRNHHHLDPALEPAKSTTRKFKQAIPGMTRPAFGKPQGGNRVDRSKALKVQRRPIRVPTTPVTSTSPQNYEVMLADPGSWLSSVRSHTDQPGASATPSTSQVETVSNANSSLESRPVVTKPAVTTKPVATRQAPAVIKPVVKMPANVITETTPATQPAGVTQTAATTSPVGLTKAVVAIQENVTATSCTATITTKPVSNLENPFFGSNLPQPQTNSSTPRAQNRPTKDVDLPLGLESPSKKKRLDITKSASEPDMMELDEDGDRTDSDTAAASVLGKKLAWMQELGFINDTLADFSLSDSNQVKQLEDRRRKLQGMIHAASNQKISKQQMTPPPEKLIELSPTPLQKAVTAQPFVPTPKPTFGDVKVPVKGGLQASRWAESDVEMANTRKESPKKTFKSKNIGHNSENAVDYWQKTLPKLPPLPADFAKNYASTTPNSPVPLKATKSLYESRYAS